MKVMGSRFFIGNHFINNLVLDSLKFKKLRTTKKELRNLRQTAYQNDLLVQHKAIPKQGEYEIALEFNSY